MGVKNKGALDSSAPLCPVIQNDDGSILISVPFYTTFL